jgi:hypothetical protein
MPPQIVRSEPNSNLLAANFNWVLCWAAIFVTGEECSREDTHLKKALP